MKVAQHVPTKLDKFCFQIRVVFEHGEIKGSDESPELTHIRPSHQSRQIWHYLVK